MMDLNGHEAGNGGYSQGKSKVHRVSPTRRPQYCSLNDPYSLGEIDSTRASPLTRAQRVVAHLTLHAPRIDPVATRYDPLFKNLVQDRLVESFSLPRGE